MQKQIDYLIYDKQAELSQVRRALGFISKNKDSLFEHYDLLNRLLGKAANHLCREIEALENPNPIGIEHGEDFFDVPFK